MIKEEAVEQKTPQKIVRRASAKIFVAII